MSLRFCDRFTKKLACVRAARQGIGMDIKEKGAFNKIRNGTKIFSVMMTSALENSIETADSMKSRGFGLRGRTSYNDYRFEVRDIFALIFTAVLAALVLNGALKGSFKFRYFPSFGSFALDWASYTAYFLLLLMHVIFDVWVELSWKYTQSKI